MNTTLSDAPLTQIPCDILVIGVSKEHLQDALSPLGSLGADLITAAEEEDFQGNEGESLLFPSYGRLPAGRVVLVGRGEGSMAELMSAAGTAGYLARERGASTVAIALGQGITAAQIHQSFLEGNYRFDQYKQSKPTKPPTETLIVVGADLGDMDTAKAVSAGQFFARDMVNEPAAALYPESMATLAQGLASDQITVDIWDEERIRAAGMGGIIGVGQGSARPPRLIHCHYRPKTPAKKTLGLVGKGVTFDAGGLSIKPSSGMLTMRCDMGGGATVLGVMRAIRDIQPDVEVHAFVGAVENMTGGNAMKLGDILSMYNGKRVEVHNTDAEGRLVMADCLALASEIGVDQVVDVATLTGACVVALGEDYAGLFTEANDLAGAILDSADHAGEGVWRMPLHQRYKKKLKAEWGDIKNLGDRWGGAITAALFLSEFVDGPEWAHLDIAGPAFHESKHRHYASGATGTLVATLTHWIANS